MERVVIYVRVSTKTQNYENQLKVLNELVELREWDLKDVYIDFGISGGKGRRERLEFDRMCKDMVKGKFDRILVWDISRLGRSLRDLVEFLSELNSVNCDLLIYNQSIDTKNVSGRMLFNMIGVFSEFEREMISERVKLGLERVKSEGIKLGRKRKDFTEIKNQIFKLKGEGLNISNISKQLNIHRNLIYRLIK
jgi:DNA invertase Pin-like site-specific DNA recombinase